MQLAAVWENLHAAWHESSLVPTESTVLRIEDISPCGDHRSHPPLPPHPPPTITLSYTVPIPVTVWSQSKHFTNHFVWLMKLIEARAKLKVTSLLVFFLFISFLFFSFLQGTFQKALSTERLH